MLKFWQFSCYYIVSVFLIPTRIYEESYRGRWQFIFFLCEEVWVEMTHLVTVGYGTPDHFHALYLRGVHLMNSMVQYIKWKSSGNWKQPLAYVLAGISNALYVFSTHEFSTNILGSLLSVCLEPLTRVTSGLQLYKCITAQPSSCISTYWAQF